MSSMLFKSMSVVGSMTLLSRISGLIRDILFANVLGDKAAADVFIVAFRLPNFFRRLFGEGAFSAAFIPVFTEYRLHKTEDENNRFLQLMIGRFGLILLLVCLAGVLFAPALVTALATGFTRDPEKFTLTVQASRLTFPYLFFISLVAMSAGMLNSCNRFAAPAATPILLNICLILATLYLVPLVDDSPVALAIGVLVAGVVQLLFQIPFLRKEKLSVRPRVIKRQGDEVGIQGARRVLALTIPAVLGVSVAQVNILVNTILASFLVTGSVSWLYYSDRLMEFPLGVFGLALSTAILPHLSRKHTQTESGDFSRTLEWGARWALLVSIPSTVGLIMLAHPMISAIYFHGDFTENGVNMTVLSLVAYSLGLTPFVLVKVLSAGFFARQNTRTPVRIAMIAVAVNIVFSLILVLPYQHVGLAVATSISALTNALMLWVVLVRQGVFVVEHNWVGFLVRILIATAAMGLSIGWLVGEQGWWLEVSVWAKAMRLGLLVGLGAITYFAALLVLGINPRSLWKIREINES